MNAQLKRYKKEVGRLEGFLGDSLDEGEVIYSQVSKKIKKLRWMLKRPEELNIKDIGYIDNSLKYAHQMIKRNIKFDEYVVMYETDEGNLFSLILSARSKKRAEYKFKKLGTYCVVKGIGKMKEQEVKYELGERWEDSK